MTWTRRTTLAAGGGFALSACNLAPASPPAPPSMGEIRRIAPALDAIVPADAAVEKLGDGFQWAEGPLWIREGGYLLFTDVPGNTMYKWSEAEGVTEFLKPSGFAGDDASHLREPGANGLAREASGAVLMADCGNRCLSRLDLATKQKTTVIDRYDGKRFNSPNDVVVHSTGAIYFTDPPYGLAGMSDSPVREIPFHGVYRLTPDGTLSVVDDTLAFPNGVALSPDEQKLYIACSDDVRQIVMVYNLGADGMPVSSSVFFDAALFTGEDRPGKPDGLAIDADGRLYQTGPGGVMVISPQAELLGVIGAGRAVANCKFGEDGSTLFLTAHDTLARIRLSTKAAGWT